MRTVSIEIKHVAPYLFNGWTGALGDKAPPNVEAEIAQGWRRLYKNGAGLVLPSGNLKAAWYEGAKVARSLFNLKRKGGAGIAQFIRSGLFIDPVEIPFGREEADGLHEEMGRIPPRTGKAVLLRRLILNEWSLAFDVLVLDPLMTDEEIEISLSTTGLYIGVGGHRPIFGRFEIVKFESKDDKERALE